MTAKEFSILIKAIKDIYDRKDFLDTDSKKSTWYALLKDLDYKTASNAVLAYMSSPDGHFEPKPADIRKYAVLTQPKSKYPTEAEFMAMLIKAVHNGLYGAAEEYAKLPPIAQEAVSEKDIETWAAQPIDSAEVWHSNARKAYRAVLARLENEQHLPPQMRVYTKKVEQKSQNTPKIVQKPETMVLEYKDYSPKGEAKEAVRRAMESLRA